MHFLILIFPFTAVFLSTSHPLDTSDTSWLGTTEDQTPVPFEDASSSSGSNLNFIDTQPQSTTDEWNLGQDPSALDLSMTANGCNDHADGLDLPLIARVRARGPNPNGDTCTTEGTSSSVRGPGSSNPIEHIRKGGFPIPVFPDAVRTDLSPNVCDQYVLLTMAPVCDSGNPADRSISQTYSNPMYPTYQLDHCHICTFFSFFSFSHSIRFFSFPRPSFRT